MSTLRVTCTRNGASAGLESEPEGHSLPPLSYTHSPHCENAVRPLALSLPSPDFMPVQTVLRAHRQIALSADLVPLFGEEGGRGEKEMGAQKIRQLFDQNPNRAG